MVTPHIWNIYFNSLYVSNKQNFCIPFSKIFSARNKLIRCLIVSVSVISLATGVSALLFSKIYSARAIIGTLKQLSGVNLIQDYLAQSQNEPQRFLTNSFPIYLNTLYAFLARPRKQRKRSLLRKWKSHVIEKLSTIRWNRLRAQACQFVNWHLIAWDSVMIPALGVLCLK